MRRVLSDKTIAIIKYWLNAVMILCGVGALACFVILIGWPLSPDNRALLHMLVRIIVAAFVIEEGIRVAIQPDPLTYLKGRWLEVCLAVVAAMELFLRGPLIALLGPGVPTSSVRALTLFYLAGTLLTVVGMITLRALRYNRFLANRHLSPGLILMISFALLISTGALLLKTPLATYHGISWTDAFFMSTSAVCVTGLGTVDLSQSFTTQGQWVILILIQIGGLGVMTLTYFFAHFFAGGVGISNRTQLRDFLSEDNLSQIGTILAVIIGFTFVLEAMGAGMIYASMAGTPQAPDELAFFSLFHAVSAFCNAGFSTYSNNLATPEAVSNLPFLGVIMVLITVGGIGFPVLRNMVMWGWTHFLRAVKLRRELPLRLTTNSRLVLITSALLTFGGAALMYVTEYVMHSGEPQGCPRWMAALFNSVTSRTAGFNVVPIDALLPATVVVLLALMFVGGSPSSTAGGIKTTTLAIAFISVRSILQGRPNLEVFGRRLDQSIAARALAIILLSLAWVTLIVGILAVLHPEFAIGDVIFEVVSALSTVGLSRGLTPHFGDIAKWLITLTMFIGRVGVLMVILSFVSRRPTSLHRLPETSVSVG